MSLPFFQFASTNGDGTGTVYQNGCDFAGLMQLELVGFDQGQALISVNNFAEAYGSRLVMNAGDYFKVIVRDDLSSLQSLLWSFRGSYDFVT